MKEKKEFKPSEWRRPGRKSANPPKDGGIAGQAGNDEKRAGNDEAKLDDVERLVAAVEAKGVDLTADYERWRNIGFALTDGLGESGRDYFHRLSRFYSGYDEEEADKQYDNCLRSHGSGITLATLFQYAKEDAGITIAPQRYDLQEEISANGGLADLAELMHRDDEDPRNGTMPTFSAKLRGKLPAIVEEIARNAFSEQDADILILGTIVTLSSCLPHVYGIYGDRPVFPNLFLFVTAPASAGKGRLSLCRRLIQPIQDQMRFLYKEDMDRFAKLKAAYERKKKKGDVAAEPPKEPVLKMLIIPANSSATMIYQILAENDGRGLIFETEGDTLANVFEKDYGDYSDGFRKAFHHEPISYTRRKDHEFVELLQPKLSTVLSGTPRQIASLIPDTENGLFSRFIFYYVDFKLTWLNVFASHGDESLDETFDAMGRRILDLYQRLEFSAEVRFSFTGLQKDAFNRYFRSAQRRYYNKYGDNFIASVRRLGLITYRIAMVLSVLRMIDEREFPELLYCHDEDFRSAMQMSGVLIRHTLRVYLDLSNHDLSKPTAEGTGRRKQLLKELPNEFDTAQAQECALRLSIPRRSVERYLAEWRKAGVIKKVTFGRYQKAFPEPNTQSAKPPVAEKDAGEISSLTDNSEDNDSQ